MFVTKFWKTCRNCFLFLLSEAFGVSINSIFRFLLGDMNFLSIATLKTKIYFVVDLPYCYATRFVGILTALFTPSWVNDWFNFENCTSECCLTLLKNKILKWEMTGFYISWLGFICYSILFFPFTSGFCGVFAWDFLVNLSLFQWFLRNFLFLYFFISSWIYVSLLVMLFIFASFLFAFAINLWWFH